MKKNKNIDPSFLIHPKEKINWIRDKGFILDTKKLNEYKNFFKNESFVKFIDYINDNGFLNASSEKPNIQIVINGYLFEAKFKEILFPLVTKVLLIFRQQVFSSIEESSLCKNKDLWYLFDENFKDLEAKELILQHKKTVSETKPLKERYKKFLQNRENDWPMTVLSECLKKQSYAIKIIKGVKSRLLKSTKDKLGIDRSPNCLTHIYRAIVDFRDTICHDGNLHEYSFIPNYIRFKDKEIQKSLNQNSSKNKLYILLLLCIHIGTKYSLKGDIEDFLKSTCALVHEFETQSRTRNICERFIKEIDDITKYKSD